MGRGGSFGLIGFRFHSVSLGLNWTHLDSDGITLDSLGFTWIRLDPLGLAWVHLHSLGRIWIQLDSLGSLGSNWVHLYSPGKRDSLPQPKGKRKSLASQKGKGKGATPHFCNWISLHVQKTARRQHARNETIFRLRGGCLKAAPTSDAIPLASIPD